MPPEQLAEAPAPVAETPATEPESTSLADHAALYGPPDPTLDGEAKTQNEEARAKVRHRARSQQASPEDAPRIQELTKRLRDVEAERDALKAPKSPPARVDPPQSAAPSAAPETRQAATPPQQGVKFDQIDEETGLPVGWTPTRPEPSIDDIGTKYATYEAFTRAQARWVHGELDAVRAAQQEQAQQARQQTEAQQSWAKAHEKHYERGKTFAAAHPDFQTLMEQHGKDLWIPAAPYHAILASEDGNAWVYYLLQHRDDAADLALLFDGKQPTDAMIAHATRWLSSRATPPAAPAAAPALALAPRPPNPVRTGAAKADDAGPDDASMSISEHEKAYGRRRPR